MIKEVLEWIVGMNPATGNILIDFALPGAVSLIFWPISYRLVGSLYSNDLISGKFLGSAFYAIINVGLTFLTIRLFNMIFPVFKILLPIAFIICVLYIVKKIK